MGKYGNTLEIQILDELGLGGFLVTSVNLSMVGIKLKRDRVVNSTLSELTNGGVYFLLVTNEEGLKSVYIGESLNIKERLKQHINDYELGKEPYYWDEAICFSNQKMSKGLALGLEAHLVKLSRAYNRVEILTQNISKRTLPSSEKVMVRGMLEHIRLVLRTFGYVFLDSKLLKDAPKEGLSEEVSKLLAETVTDELEAEVEKEVKEVKELVPMGNLLSINDDSERDKLSGLLKVRKESNKEISTGFMGVVLAGNIDIDDEILYYYLDYKGCKAVGYYDETSKFNVLGGSILTKGSVKGKDMRHVRSDLIRAGVVQDGKLVVDVEFSKASVAALFMCLKTIEWKNMYE